MMTLRQALDVAYPTPDTMHTSVMMRNTEDRNAFIKGWIACDGVADDLLRQVLKEADEFAVEMGLEPGQLKDESGLLAHIRTYVEGLDK